MATPNATHPTRNARSSFITVGVLQGSIRIAFLLALMLLSPRIVSAGGVREDRPNLIGGEVLGRGFALTGNYERYLTNHFGLGVGFMMVGSSGSMIGVMPVYASFLSGDTHSLYLGAGATFFTGSGGDEGMWIPQGSIGYQFQSPDGFFVRPFFTVNVDRSGGGSHFIWPGLTIGGSF